MGKEPAVIQQEIAATRERLGDTAGALADKANVPARVSRTLDAFGEGTAGRSPKDMLSADELRRATRGVAGFARENPFGFAIGALAAGFIVGMLLPATEIEDERIGAVSDSVKAEVREAGHEALEYTKGVGQSALAQGAAPEAIVEGESHGDESTRERAGEVPADLDG